jgi:regulatory protein
MGSITALEVQKRNKERVNVFVDGEYTFSLNLMDAARLRKGQTLSEAEIAALQGEDTVIQAVDSAAHFLGYRPRSLAEVRRNLAEKEFTPAVIEAAMSRLSAMGYVDDTAFARYWAQNRSEFKPLSAKALRQELRQKGVADEVITEALDTLDETALAEQAARTQLRRLRNLTLRDFRRKLATFLQRRGFAYSITREVTERLIEELTDSDPDYFIQGTPTNEE